MVALFERERERERERDCERKNESKRSIEREKVGERVHAQHKLPKTQNKTDLNYSNSLNASKAANRASNNTPTVAMRVVEREKGLQTLICKP